MLSECSQPHAGLLDESLGQLFVTTFQTGRNLKVVNAKSIQSVVAFLPFDKLADHWFLFEDFGLDIALLTSDSYLVDGGLDEVLVDQL